MSAISARKTELSTLNDARNSLVRDFVSNSLSVKEVTSLRQSGIPAYIETECVDERVMAQTILPGKIRLELNVPGGGIDYLTEKDLEYMLQKTDANLVLDPHRSCGWAELGFNFYSNYGEEIKDKLPGTTMLLRQGQHFKNGREYLHSLIKRAFSDGNFLNSLARSVSLQLRFGFAVDLEKALEKAFSVKTKITFQDDLHKELILLAYAFAKILELQERLEELALKHGYFEYFIKLNPDMLFDQPHHHISDTAVFNLTDRRLVKRFQLNGRPAYFVDTDMPRLIQMIELVLLVMGGEHSRAKEGSYNLNIIVPKTDLKKLKATVAKLKAGLKIKNELFINMYTLGNNKDRSLTELKKYLH